jgi:hypothetical protein
MRVLMVLNLIVAIWIVVMLWDSPEITDQEELVAVSCSHAKPETIEHPIWFPGRRLFAPICGVPIMVENQYDPYLDCLFVLDDFDYDPRHENQNYDFGGGCNEGISIYDMPPIKWSECQIAAIKTRLAKVPARSLKQ